mmetsp:Transcript_51387/g.119435  ORF Transcript_51387/g.119435 Transcript_51387/m.119435 type:complete len:293 (-) Transcript_51387:83-961(-)
MDLRGVIALRNIGDCDAAFALLQQPANELLAALPLFQCPSNEGHVPDVLQNRAGGALQFLACGTLLPQRVAELIILEEHPVSAETLLGAGFLSDTLGERAWILRLHATHDLQLRTAATALGTADDQHLRATTAAPALVSVLVHEEHEYPPLLLQRSKCSAPSTSDIANAIPWDVHDRAIVPLLPTLNVDRPFELLEQPLDVFATSPALLAWPGEDGNVPDVLHNGTRGTLELLARATLLAEGIGELIILEGHGVRAPSARPIFAVVAVEHLTADLFEVAGHLGLHCAEHLQL